MILDQSIPAPRWRMYLMVGLFFVGFMILLAAMAYRQLFEGGFWSEQMAQGSTRTVKLTPPRGRILDRNGVILVGNRPSYNVALYLDEFGYSRGQRSKLFKAVESSVDELKKKMKMSAKVDKNTLLRHYDQRGPLPLTVWNDLSFAALAAFEERSPWRKGVDLQIEPVRVYSYGKLACHILGRVGKPETDQQDLESMFDSKGRRSFSQPMTVGKTGIEASFEKDLKGIPGEDVIHLNAAGFKESEYKNRSPTPGRNVVLTLDQEIQAIIEESFSGYRGAVVVLDPRNGAILGMASFPAYDPNLFIPAITKAEWQNLVQDDQNPLINRAIQGNYHPGSTFKVVTALAGLESGSLSPNRHIECAGKYYLGPIEFKCWQAGGHGDVDLKEAIKESCNVYFYTVGKEMGGQAIWDMGNQFGLGEKTGIEISNESRGLLPSEEWKKANLPRELSRWTAGDSVNMSIGQGYLEVTPLQMANVVATVANGGVHYQLRLVDRIETFEGKTVEEFKPKELNRLRVSPENLRIIREDMLSVVEEEGGTGRSARQPKIKIAGKTGSAQSPRRDPETGEMIKQTTTWMISFAPYEEPRYAMVVVAEAGDSGGHTCGPFTGAIYKKIFQLEEDRLHPHPPASAVALPVSDKISGSEGEVGGQLQGDGASSENSGMNTPVDNQEEEDGDTPPSSFPAEKVDSPQ